MDEIQRIIDTIDEFLINNNKVSTTPVEVCRYLDRKGVLKDNKSRRGKSLRNILRKGKYIIIQVDKLFLLCHLRMTGYLYMSSSLPKNKKHNKSAVTIKKTKDRLVKGISVDDRINRMFLKFEGLIEVIAKVVDARINDIISGLPDW